MNRQEHIWFEELTDLRRSLREALKNNNFDRIWDAITSPYSDQAHFIYELLQNADDSGAQEVNFELFDDKLVFTHNGTKRFSISNPNCEQEKEDATQGLLGDVNSITGAGNSTKKENNSIGKFGIGFKSVFIYTNRPEIYDDNMQFSISDYMIPELLEKDYPGRKQGTTVFVFPFRENEFHNSVKDILEKLKNLICPTLFLRNVNRITWTCKKAWTFGSYSHRTTAKYDHPDKNVKVEIVSLSKEIDQTFDNKSFILLSRSVSQNDNLHYAVGFGLDADNKIQPVDYTAFCYFPTKVSTNLRFIIHAPFILTSDRSNISETSEHLAYNQGLLDNLAMLMADSLSILVSLGSERGCNYLDDNFILNGIVPLQIPKSQQWEHLVLDNFYYNPLAAFKSNKIIPCADGHCSKEHAFAIEYAHMQTFDDADLCEFTGDPNARWIFTSTPINQGHIAFSAKDNIIRPYILELTKNRSAFAASSIFEIVKGAFIEGKINDTAWLRKFYKWVADLATKSIMHFNNSKSYALLLNQNGEATPLLKDRCDNLFLPAETGTNFNTVHPSLHVLPEVQDLEERYGMHEPEAIDVINSLINKAKEASTEEELDGCIKKLIQRACLGETTVDDRRYIVEKLKDSTIGKFRNQTSPVKHKAASELYRKCAKLENFFDCTSGDEWFIDDCYYDLCNGAKELLTEIGITASLHTHKTYRDFGGTRHSWDLPEYLRAIQEERSFKEIKPFIPGMEEKLERIEELSLSEENKGTAAEYAKQIWDVLLEIAATDSSEALQCALKGIYVYRGWHGKIDMQKYFNSPLLVSLLEKQWIFTQAGDFKSAKEIDSAALPVEFMQHQYANDVCSLLSITIKNDETIQQAIDALPESERQAIIFGRVFQQSGITNEDDIKRALELLRQEKDNIPPNPPEGFDPPIFPPEPNPDPTDLENVRKKAEEAKKKTRKYKERKNGGKPTHDNNDPNKQDDEDDVMQPQTIDYAKKIDELQKKLEEEIAQLQEAASLQEIAVTAEEYTYLWLKSRIDLEIKANGVDDDSQKEATVKFAKIEKEQGSVNTFILSSPSSEIPQWFEEEVDQPLILEIPGRNDIRTVIENMSIDGYKLKARIKILPGMENVDYSKVMSATTIATRPAFLLDSLRIGVANLNFEDGFNLKENLTKDIKFIFGPPGTGKTTYLAREELIPLAKKTEAPHVLVLAPTNKAADVLLKRIIQEMGDDKSYEKWLFRFGHTLDSDLENSPVVCEKKVSLQQGQPAVVVTTMSRFAYDVLMPAEKVSIPISTIDWDYIVIDEASMIPLMQILYPLYRVPVAKFIIAGDPMQIEPVIKSDLSKGENIYTMVELTDFANPRTVPYEYEVVRLFTQYRSIPAIGEVFSRFAYSGLLEHHRKNNEVQSLLLDSIPEIKPLTMLRFPVGKYENIYRVQSLAKRSSYHVYAALFAFEYVCKIAAGLQKNNHKKFRIGVISPYRAQAEIIGRLLAKYTLPAEISVNVGTVHGFQGDECEMIIAMLNPPRGMGKGGSSFINDKKVLNVAISRAKNYLIVMAPSRDTWNIQYLTGPNEIMDLMSFLADHCLEYHTPELEQSIWGDKSYIDHNTFPTGHQAVNVYEQPEKRFEIRASEDAIDVQFHENRIETKASSSDKDSELSRMKEAAEAEEKERQNFTIPEGFHRPEMGETIPLEKGYYILGKLDECQYYEDPDTEIDMSKVVAIED